MNISDMIEFVNIISSFDLEECEGDKGISMSEIREDKIEKCPHLLEKQVAVSKVEGV